MKLSRLAGIWTLVLTAAIPNVVWAQAEDEPQTTQESPGDEEGEPPRETTDDVSEEPVAGPEIALAEEGGREHRGFYLRGTLGLGYGSGSEQVQDVDFESSGFGLMLSVAIGGALVENLILDADLFIAYVFKPNVTLDGADVGDSDATQSSTGLGLGLTYYFTPVNLYLAGSAGLGFVTVTNQGYSSSTDMGWGLNALVGKEWWIDERSGIGVAAQFMYVSAPEANVDARFDMYFVGISASVSYD